MALSKDEIEILKASREIGDMLNLPAWKRYESYINEHIAARYGMLTQPAQALDANRVPGESRMDGVSLFAASECIKGAIIGLKLALSLPRTILDHAQELRNREHGRGDSEEDAA